MNDTHSNITTKEIRKVLGEQLQLLAKQSKKKGINNGELIGLTTQMTSLGGLLLAPPLNYLAPAEREQ